MVVAIQELKHSIKLHMSMAGGPSAELCIYTLKLIDFLDEDPNDEEIMSLSCSILKSIALKIGDTVEKYAENDPQFPSATLKQGQVLKGCELFVIKNPEGGNSCQTNHGEYGFYELLLAEIAKTLDMLKEYTKIEYPLISYKSLGKGL